MDVAFERLRSHARNTNQRLAKLARRVVDGELDPAMISAPAVAAGRLRRS